MWILLPLLPTFETPTSQSESRIWESESRFVAEILGWSISLQCEVLSQAVRVCVCVCVCVCVVDLSTSCEVYQGSCLGYFHTQSSVSSVYKDELTAEFQTFKRKLLLSESSHSLSLLFSDFLNNSSWSPLGQFIYMSFKNISPKHVSYLLSVRCEFGMSCKCIDLCSTNWSQPRQSSYTFIDFCESCAETWHDSLNSRSRISFFPELLTARSSSADGVFSVVMEMDVLTCNLWLMISCDSIRSTFRTSHACWLKTEASELIVDLRYITDIMLKFVTILIN